MIAPHQYISLADEVSVCRTSSRTMLAQWHHLLYSLKLNRVGQYDIGEKRHATAPDSQQISIQLMAVDQC